MQCNRKRALNNEVLGLRDKSVVPACPGWDNNNFINRKQGCHMQASFFVPANQGGTAF